MEKYNGWKNRSTWNVMLWINNDYGLYRAAKEYKQNTKGSSYKGFIEYAGLSADSTPDGIKWISSKLSYSELNKAFKEL